jgi:hypothetical protein
VSYRDRQRPSDIQAIDAIRSRLQRGTLTDGLVFGAVRIRLLEIGEAVKALPAGSTPFDDDLPELERAIKSMAASLTDDEEDDRTQ